MTVSPLTWTALTRLPPKLCPGWLIFEPTASESRIVRTLPEGTVTISGMRGCSLRAICCELAEPGWPEESGAEVELSDDGVLGLVHAAPNPSNNTSEKAVARNLIWNLLEAIS